MLNTVFLGFEPGKNRTVFVFVFYFCFTSVITDSILMTRRKSCEQTFTWQGKEIKERKRRKQKSLTGYASIWSFYFHTSCTRTSWSFIFYNCYCVPVRVKLVVTARSSKITHAGVTSNGFCCPHCKKSNTKRTKIRFKLSKLYLVKAICAKFCFNVHENKLIFFKKIYCVSSLFFDIVTCRRLLNKLRVSFSLFILFEPKPILILWCCFAMFPLCYFCANFYF